MLTSILCYHQHVLHTRVRVVCWPTDTLLLAIFSTDGALRGSFDQGHYAQNIMSLIRSPQCHTVTSDSDNQHAHIRQASKFVTTRCKTATQSSALRGTTATRRPRAALQVFLVQEESACQLKISQLRRQDSMGRKLRHVLVFLIIILKEPNMLEADCSCISSLYCRCTGMGLTSIPQDLPTSISELDLSHNRIETVSQPMLVRYREVTKFVLSYNRITMIMNTFPNLPKLRCLLLDHNQITVILPGTFVNLPQLQGLYLNYNQIRMIHPGTFAIIPQLQELYLSHNQITVILPGTFVNIPQLQGLYLNYNQIRMIHPGTFAIIPQLQELYLGHNQITVILPGTFANPQLQGLYLNCNQIRMIHPGTFANIPQLQGLYLSHNQITVILPGTFANIPQLQDLYVSYNQITMIPPGAFENLPRLQTLYLRGNQITTIHPSTFGNLSQLQMLCLNNNQITKIQPHAFANLPKLQNLDLGWNKMSSIPPFAYSLLTSVPTVKLDGNPWQCDCRMAPVRLNPAFNDQIKCAQPAKVQGQKLADVNPRLICEGPTRSTPHVDAQNTFASTTMSKSSSFRKTEIKLDPTTHPVASPFATTGIISDILLTFNKREINRSHKSSPSFSLPALIGSVCGTAALSIVAAVLIRIWCKRNSKNPPSGPTSNIALSNINTTATVPTSGSHHDQTWQGQSLASTQPLNIKHPSHVRRPAVSQTHYYVDADTPNPKTPKGLPPLCDDDEPTYVEPDGAHYMTPEDVLYEMPANSHCEDDNLHYYQPLKKEENLPTDASGYILVVPNNPKGQC
ncbi:uncharacterized protein LOC144911048 isoform X2 [Branchiostoma floridae x Branchiostoma belcheri]